MLWRDFQIVSQNELLFCLTSPKLGVSYNQKNVYVFFLTLHTWSKPIDKKSTSSIHDYSLNTCQQLQSLSTVPTAKTDNKCVTRQTIYGQVIEYKMFKFYHLCMSSI